MTTADTTTKTDPAQLEAAATAGYLAFYQDAKYTENPYTGDLADEWSKGWLAADDDLSRDSMRYVGGIGQ